MAIVNGNNTPEIINALDGVTNNADLINGFGGADRIFGLGGDDTIVGGDDGDTIDGGGGSDTASYEDSFEGVLISLTTNKGFNGTAEGDKLTSIENLTGSAFADILVGDDAANVLRGLGDNDVLMGGGGADTLLGGQGSDTLKGGGGADWLLGGAGTDTASYANSSAGVFVSLISNDAAFGDAEGDQFDSIENVTGSSHDDDLWGDNDANVLKGNDGNDSLKGGGGTDTLHGGDGDDELDGGAANDTMIGGLGNDEYFVDNAGDIVTELAGQGTSDVVFSNMVSYTLAANVEILSLADSLVGIDATGNALANTIFGNANDNTLNGAAGSDSLSGLGGNDTFVFVAGQAQGDTIYEFNGNGPGAGDVIRFEGYGTLAEGATFHQLSATHWQVTSANGLIQETIVFAGPYTFDTTTDLIFA